MSYLQFDGPITRKRGFGLTFYLVNPVTRIIGQRADGTSYGYDTDVDAEVETCSQCGQAHPVLYRAWRKPVGTFGPWTVFRYNGDEHVPDLSIPIRVSSLPRGSVRLTADESARYWHS
jgi:hypothetical protein